MHLPSNTGGCKWLWGGRDGLEQFSKGCGRGAHVCAGDGLASWDLGSTQGSPSITESCCLVASH